MEPTPGVSAAQVGALARKYEALVGLRARRDETGPPATREELRALAAEFPGCLRELDTLGAVEIDRRAVACRAAAGGGPIEPWMAWIAAYHDHVAAALAVRARPPDQDRTAPGERLNARIFRELAVRFGVPASTIAGNLFPLRRPSPYEL